MWAPASSTVSASWREKRFTSAPLSISSSPSIHTWSQSEEKRYTAVSSTLKQASAFAA